MTDDELLVALGRRAREENEDPEIAALERLARGEVDASDLPGIDDDARDLFRPLDAAAEERIASAILSAGAARNGPALRVVRGGEDPSGPPGSATSENRTPKLTLVRLAPVILAAAAVFLFLVIPRGTELPNYVVEISGDVASVRSDGPKVVETRATLHREAQLQIVLRPGEPTEDPVVATAALVQDGRATPLAAKIEVSADGAVRVSGPVSAVFPGPGAFDVVVAIAPEGKLPTDLAKAASEPPRGVRVLRATISVQP
jgi:hypothetical protein